MRTAPATAQLLQRVLVELCCHSSRARGGPEVLGVTPRTKPSFTAKRATMCRAGAREPTADDLRAAGTAASSGPRGNDRCVQFLTFLFCRPTVCAPPGLRSWCSPARSVRLEAIGPSSSASDLRLPSVTLPAYDLPESSTQQANVDDEAEPSHSPSHPSSAAETSADSFLLAQTSHTPFDLGLPSDSPFASDDYEGDAMSESSTDTHIVVPRPGNEEDSAERRWRLAEQRGIDIRRASSVLSPRFQGTTTYLKVIVVCICAHGLACPMQCSTSLHALFWCCYADLNVF